MNMTDVPYLTKMWERMSMDKETYIVTIQTHDIVFSNESHLDYLHHTNGFNLCFARDKKFACTKNKAITIDSVTKQHVLELNEPLSIAVSLYKSKETGMYQEKYGKLILRTFDSEKVKYNGLCAFTLKLHTLIPNFMDSIGTEAASESKDFVWPIDGGGELALDASFTCQRINHSDQEMVDMVTLNTSCSYKNSADPIELAKNQRIIAAITPAASPTGSLNSSPSGKNLSVSCKEGSRCYDYEYSPTSRKAQPTPRELKSSKQHHGLEQPDTLVC